MKKALSNLATLLILCLVAGTTFVHAGPKPAAVGTAVGEVSLNGKALIRSGSILAGDKIATGDDSAFMLNLAGSTVRIGPNSRLEFRGDTLALEAGSVLVRGLEGVLAGDGTFAPVQRAVFVVERVGAGTKLTLSSGRVKVERAGKAETIGTPGEYSFGDTEKPAAAAKPRLSPKVGAAAGAAAGAAGIVQHWISNAGGKTRGAGISNSSPGERSQ